MARYAAGIRSVWPALVACCIVVALLVVPARGQEGTSPITTRTTSAPSAAPPAVSFRLAQEHFLKGRYESATGLYEELGKV
ncbi:MAG: hypothetical protein V3S01_00890, partial [Dehalococcoidia bacterium]